MYFTVQPQWTQVKSWKMLAIYMIQTGLIIAVKRRTYLEREGSDPDTSISNSVRLEMQNIHFNSTNNEKKRREKKIQNLPHNSRFIFVLGCRQTFEYKNLPSRSVQNRLPLTKVVTEVYIVLCFKFNYLSFV